MKRVHTKLSVVALLGTFAFLSLNLFADPNETRGERDGLRAIHRSSHRANGADPTAGSNGAVTPLINYHGGALVTSPTVYLIWYGNWNSGNGSDTPAGQQIVRDFLNNIGGSPYFKINQTYSTNAYQITGNLTFGGECSDAGSVGLTNLSDASIAAIVSNALNANLLPSNPSGIYFVLTSSANVTKTGFCTSVCGWHTSGSVRIKGRSKLTRYAWVGNANACLNNCAAQSPNSPNGNPGVDGMISILAHEINEATTDPDPFSGWADVTNAENGDKCAWTFGTTSVDASGAFYNVTLGSRNYLIQRNLSRNPDGNNYCVLQ